jgi:hypothetical protein
VSSDTESRLGELFAQLPKPDAEVGDRALARALDALPLTASRRHRPALTIRALVFVLAAVIALLAASAGALAAVGALHVSFGQSPHRSPQRSASPASQLAVPHGARGVAVTVDGRLWLTTASGLRLQGLPVTAAALSPHARYVAVGLGKALVAMAPEGRRAWSHPTPGHVVAIGWAPNGLRIAYIVKTGGRFRLYAIEGNGDHNHLIDPTVRATTPTWRGDSLALAYVSGGGRPVVYDLGHRSHTAISNPVARDATSLTFNPSGDDSLAVATRHAVLLVAGNTSTKPTTFQDETVAGIGWVDGKLAVALNPRPPTASTVRLFRVTTGGGLIESGRLTAAARIEGLDAWGSRLTLAVASGSNIRILSTTIPTAGATARSKLLLRVPAANQIGTLATR